MPEYIVNVREVHVQSYKVTAADPEASKAIIASDGGEIIEDMLEFSHRLDRKFWTVDLVENRSQRGKNKYLKVEYLLDCMKGDIRIKLCCAVIRGQAVKRRLRGDINDIPVG